MGIRVTQGLMYNSFVGNMNRNLGSLMESNIQSSSQKKVNRPSDDPFNAGRILNTRSTLTHMSVYMENINQAMGWLTTADGIVGSGSGSVQTVLTRLQELAEQGATETYDKMNREQIAYEIRQMYEQLINLANTKFDGRHIFAGQKTDKPPYVAGLAVDCYNNPEDPDETGGLNEASFHVDGASATTVMIQATSTGRADEATYEYSNDGGKTWEPAIVTKDYPLPGECSIKAGGVSVRVSDGSKKVTAVDPDSEQRSDTGTRLNVRPTAIYQGDEDSHQVVMGYGTSVSGTADGYFTRNVAVRIDSVQNGEVSYSYSLDDGSNWVQSKAPDGMHLAVPGGYLTLSGTPAEGDQFQVQPHLADIKFQIGENDSITVNMVGTDIFGGRYNYPQDDKDYPVEVTGQANLFEVVGRLVAAAETNSPDDMGKAVEELKEVMNVVLTRAAEIGGRENRLEVTHGALVIRTYSEEDNLSQMEDVDLSELMTRLSQQQIAYNSVLKSSSMIMQMSLVNFL